MDIEQVRHYSSNILKVTNFPGLGERKQGKVRDSYFTADRIVMVATDRHSSFDRIIAHVPVKGQVLTQTSRFWFEQTQDIVPNHALSYPDPNVVVGKRCQVLPVEVVVRGFITGVTDTSLWTLYQRGERDFGDFILPEGMKKNQRLKHPVITPTTKSDEHDRSLTPAQVVSEGFVATDLWRKVQQVALALFTRGQAVALA
ncbi:MAG: phosphoribosylaminoimidazolesuccinocarboxamide synthase, partial [Candidatus Veblenbacteria bacterium]|nr:phosphoribosylaminoimidazolesuccinocarboxamide synthase [Candidatus Veblenbacteria bacterium]